MSWRSPSTVPTTARNSGTTPAAARTGSRISVPAFMARAAISISGTNSSPSWNSADPRVHGTCHRVEDRLGVDALVDGLLGELGGGGPVAGLDGGGEGGEVGHGGGSLMAIGACREDGTQIQGLTPVQPSGRPAPRPQALKYCSVRMAIGSGLSKSQGYMSCSTMQ